jgi:hypothetical protein
MACGSDKKMTDHSRRRLDAEAISIRSAATASSEIPNGFSRRRLDSEAIPNAASVLALAWPTSTKLEKDKEKDKSKDKDKSQR